MDIVTREKWGARPPERIHFIDTPTPELWLHHTGGHETGAAGMRRIQAFHMDPKPKGRGWSDIAYSFVVDDDALTVYEGRGAGVAGGHTAGHNTISHAICVMGNFEIGVPDDALIERIAQLVAHGYRQGWWPAQLTGGHRDASGASTACPGRWLEQVIPSINFHALTLTEETDMPPSITYDRAMAQLDELWLAYRGTRPPEGDRRAWGRDLAEKILNRGEDPQPTLAYIEWILREQHAKAKA